MSHVYSINYSTITYYTKILNQYFLRLVVNSKPQKRNLLVHEYVSYALFKKHGIEAPMHHLASTPAEARAIAEKWNIRDMIVKAQVLSGSRAAGIFTSGLKGGYHFAESPEEVEEIASKMIGHKYVTTETGPAGKPCNVVMIAKRTFIRKEYYFAIVMLSTFGGPIIVASSEGGTQFRHVAKNHPELVTLEVVDIVKGVTQKQCEDIASRIGLENIKQQIAEFLMKMYNLFIKTDALIIEVNPYAEDATGKYISLNARCRFDDHAAFKQKEIFANRDLSQEERKESDARKFDLSYIELDGNIGCMVNGAGLAMATMDIISMHGGAPANFLDVGGTASAQVIEQAFKIINEDEKVCAILINVFGGILSCTTIAEGIILATKSLDLNIPVVCRLLGLDVKEANKLLIESGMKIIPVTSLDEAAKKVVDISRIVEAAKKANLRITFQKIEHT